LKTKVRPHHIGIISLGCAKNLIDSELLHKQLDSNHLKISFDPVKITGIDTMVINTCGFTGDAKQESIDTILYYVNAKSSGDLKHIFVMGCLSERYREQLKADIPEVDAFYGVNDLKLIVRDLGAHYNKHLLGERKISTPSHYAYLKIAEGCDRKCSFCAIPNIRGKHHSRATEDILEEANFLAETGVKEIIVISQDTTYYGLDLYKRRKITSLLEQLAGIKDIGWIRLHYTYPDKFPPGLLDLINNHPKICKYLDIPLQHINDRILRSMRRGISSTDTRRLIKTIRNVVPGIILRTSFILGYPGETEKEFRELMDFTAEMQFDRLGVFTYSHEEDTHAFSKKDNISPEVKQERADELMTLQEQISFQKNKMKIGKTMNVLIDRFESGHFIARSEGDSPEIDNEILISANRNKLKVGTFSQVIVTSAESFDLCAEPAPMLGVKSKKS
jgi:ribosomal protein S12 methylthiotransferase